VTAVLVDSSVWIDSLSGSVDYDVREAVDLDAVVNCPPVIQEVLQGIRVERAYRAAREALLSFPLVESPMSMRLWLSASQVHRMARRAGITLRTGSRDTLIAACALRHDLPVLHRDRDFERLAEVVPLRTIPVEL